MLDALERGFPETSSWNRPEGGYFLWLDLGSDIDASELAERAGGKGVGIVRGADFVPRGSDLGGSSARLAFSYEPVERIAEGIARLGALLR